MTYGPAKVSTVSLSNGCSIGMAFQVVWMVRSDRRPREDGGRRSRWVVSGRRAGVAPCRFRCLLQEFGDVGGGGVDAGEQRVLGIEVIGAQSPGRRGVDVMLGLQVVGVSSDGGVGPRVEGLIGSSVTTGAV